MRRALEVLWVTEHLDDLESDFSAIHRVDDMLELPSVKFFKMAYRMTAYQGVMQARASEDSKRRTPGTSSVAKKAGDQPVKQVTPRALADMSNGAFIKVK